MNEIYYLVVDTYDGMPEIIAVCTTKSEAKQAKEQYRADVNGKCCLYISKSRKHIENGKEIFRPVL